jgi:hypothetical protein
MESAAQDDWDVDDLEAPEDMNQIIPEELDNAEGCYYYVALYLRRKSLPNLLPNPPWTTALPPERR